MYDILIFTIVLAQAFYSFYWLAQHKEEVQKLRTRLLLLQSQFDSTHRAQKEYVDTTFDQFGAHLNSVNQAWADELEGRFQALEHIVTELTSKLLDVTERPARPPPSSPTEISDSTIEKLKTLLNGDALTMENLKALQHEQYYSDSSSMRIAANVNLTDVD